VCFYDGKLPFEGEGGSADQFFLLSTKGQAGKVFNGSALVYPSLVSIEVIDGQENETTYYAPDKQWMTGGCGYVGTNRPPGGFQPYKEFDEEIKFAKLMIFTDYKTGQTTMLGCTVTTIRKSTWRFTYHQEIVAGEHLFADYPGRCFVIPKQPSGR
jgi:hypothetical protein